MIENSGYSKMQELQLYFKECRKMVGRVLYLAHVSS
jgi:hypothetical protein